MARPLTEPTRSPEGATSTAAVIAQAWARALEVDHVDAGANFFALGGDSFTAMRLLALVEDETGVPVTFSDLLDAPVLHDFVERVTTASGRRSAGPKRKPGAPAPMTPVQLEQWRGRRRAPSGAEVYWLCEIEGPLDVEALRGAFDELVKRHEILRTTFRRRFGRPRQVILKSWPSLLRVIDASAELPKRLRNPAGVAQHLFEQDYGTFDYERGPLLRATLVALGPRRYVLSVAASEMVLDGSSRRVFVTALSTLYSLLVETGSADAYPYPPLQFGDFATALRDRVGRRSRMDQLAYWRTKVRDREPGVALRRHDLAPEIDWTKGIPDRSLELPAHLVADVRETSRAHAISMFNVLAAAFGLVLHAVAETDEPTFTTTVSHRDVSGPEVIGTFFNIVVVAVPLARVATVGDLLEATAAATKEAFVNREVPLNQVIRLRKRSLADASLLDTARVRFQLHEDPGRIQLAGTRVRPLPPPFKPTHGLYLAATGMPDDRLSLYFSCRPDMSRQVVANVLTTYRKVLEAITDDPDAPVAGVVEAARRALVR